MFLYSENYLRSIKRKIPLDLNWNFLQLFKGENFQEWERGKRVEKMRCLDKPGDLTKIIMSYQKNNNFGPDPKTADNGRLNFRTQ